MSAVCTCYKAEVVREPGKEPWCSKCGFWWSLDLGSRDPALWRQNLAARRSLPRIGPKTGRNDACPCGSGIKFKKCCLPIHQSTAEDATRKLTVDVVREGIRAAMEKEGRSHVH